MESKLTTGIKLLTMCMEEIEDGSPRWQGRGGQSHGWTVKSKIAARYKVPIDIIQDVMNGLLRARTPERRKPKYPAQIVLWRMAYSGPKVIVDEITLLDVDDEEHRIGQYVALESQGAIRYNRATVPVDQVEAFVVAKREELSK